MSVCRETMISWMSTCGWQLYSNYDPHTLIPPLRQCLQSLKYHTVLTKICLIYEGIRYIPCNPDFQMLGVVTPVIISSKYTHCRLTCQKCFCKFRLYINVSSLWVPADSCRLVSHRHPPRFAFRVRQGRRRAKGRQRGVPSQTRDLDCSML